MKKFAPLSVIALCAVAGFAFAGGNEKPAGAAKDAMKAEAAKSMDVIDTAVAAGNFKTLATALTHCDLVGALKGKGPFTVFAPTDEAFAKLPKGTLEELLKPENKDKLTQILKYHVIAGEVTAEQVTKMKESSATLQGQTFDIIVKDGKVTIGNSKMPTTMATVTKTDIKTSNGIIHVIDTVIMPRQ
jgi:uncharacterized surface protein with fasciclin (FAS1) repeats